MKQPILITLLALLVVCTSCNSLRTISAKDGSTSTKTNKKQSSKELKFLDNIEVKPGSVVTSKHKSSGAKKQTAYKYTDKATTNMEEANWLQFKYAIIADVDVESLTNIALLQKLDEWWGTRYCIGGESKSCIDCSAFTSTLMRDIYNFQVPRTAQDQYNACDRIAAEDLKEGDLVFFHTSGRSVSHVGLYLANNKFAHASTSEGVTIGDLTDGYWQPRFIAGGRIKIRN
ncbi:C40 family peptidase [Parasediminibacterium sp. JCM 36343]|uniref:C40 family peptidase n=1 Tax=Parasediminibacterium sp. JCM 36343 TaxID=3374279 RepID=UPI00397B5A72